MGSRDPNFFWMYFPGESERIRWDRRGSAQVRALLARPWARIVQGRTPLTKGGSHCADNFASRRSWRPCCWSSCWSRWCGCSSTEGGPPGGAALVCLTEVGPLLPCCSSDGSRSAIDGSCRGAGLRRHSRRAVFRVTWSQRAVPVFAAPPADPCCQSPAPPNLDWAVLGHYWNVDGLIESPMQHRHQTQQVERILFAH